MLIYFNGDSNTAGTDLVDPDNECYYAVISKHYNAKWINHAVGGVSPDHILHSTRSYLHECYRSSHYPDLMVIGWSEWNRMEAFHKGRRRPIPDIEEKDQSLFEHYSKSYKVRQDQSAAMAIYFNQQIKNLHDELDWLGIPHLFFNAIECLTCQDIAATNIYIHNWGGRYFEPYSQSLAMREWAFANNFKEMVPGWGHFEPAAQTAWANMLIQHLSNNKII